MRLPTLRRSRVHGARRILANRAAAARNAAIRAEADHEHMFAASLRGKARAYTEAADLLGRLEDNRPLPPKSKDHR